MDALPAAGRGGCDVTGKDDFLILKYSDLKPTKPTQLAQICFFGLVGLVGLFSKYLKFESMLYIFINDSVLMLMAKGLNVFYGVVVVPRR